MVCEIWFPDQGWNPGPPALRAWSLSHWTAREIPTTALFLISHMALGKYPLWPSVTLSSKQKKSDSLQCCLWGLERVMRTCGQRLLVKKKKNLLVNCKAGESYCSRGHKLLHKPLLALKLEWPFRIIPNRVNMTRASFPSVVNWMLCPSQIHCQIPNPCVVEFGGEAFGRWLDWDAVMRVPCDGISGSL